MKGYTFCLTAGGEEFSESPTYETAEEAFAAFNRAFAELSWPYSATLYRGTEKIGYLTKRRGITLTEETI